MLDWVHEPPSYARAYGYAFAEQDRGETQARVSDDHEAGMKPFQPWKVLHLSIQDGWPDLSAEPGVGGLFIVFWSNRIPLGQMVIPSQLLPIPSAQLAASVPLVIAPVVREQLLGKDFEPPRLPGGAPLSSPSPDLTPLLALDRPLERLFSLVSPEESRLSTPSVSLVICTRNRPERLEQCLLSIRGLSSPPDEVIVVDNDPSSGLTRPVAERFQDVSYVGQARPGLSAARNAGILSARSAIIAFTDDDVIVHSGWIGAIRAAFDDQQVIAVTGLVLPAELVTRAQYVFQIDPLGSARGYRAVDFDSAFFESTKGVGAPVWRLGAGANMAFRREAFQRIGLFDERLGAGASGCSEDSELWYRLLAEGHQCRYAPTAVVFHHHRAEWNELRYQTYSYMRGHVAALLFQFDRYGHWGNIYRAFLSLPWYLANIGYHATKRWAGGLISDLGDESLFQPVAPQIRGVVAGYGYWLRHRRFRTNAPELRDDRLECSGVDPQR